MTRRYSRALAGLVILSSLSFPSFSYATPVISVENGGVVNSTVSGTSVFDFDTTSPTLSTAQSADLYSSSVSSVAAEPYHFSNGNRYFSVGGGSAQSTTTITASQLGGSSFSYFGLYWGSMDSYNTLAFYNGASLLYSLTGGDAAALVSAAATGNQASDANNRFLNFDFGSQAFTSVVFTSGSPAFETDNWTVRSSEQTASGGGSGVPEPRALTILGLLALPVLHRSLRRRKSAAPI